MLVNVVEHVFRWRYFCVIVPKRRTTYQNSKYAAVLERQKNHLCIQQRPFVAVIWGFKTQA